VKKKKSNLNIITIIQKIVINCEVLDLERTFQSTYFGHVFLKITSICYNRCEYVYEFQIYFIIFTQANCKSALVGLKTMGKVDENQIKLCK
jgi:hypothetical protein